MSHCQYKPSCGDGRCKCRCPSCLVARSREEFASDKRGELFVVEIKLGNDAMLTAGEVSAALQRVATKFAKAECPPLVGDGGPVMDANGNRVGSWEVK